MCCCNKTLVFCEAVPTCAGSLIDFGIVAQVQGTHKLKVNFKRAEFIIETEFEIGEQIKFPTDGLNENYVWTGKLSDPNGVNMIIEKNGIQYDCVQFKTAQQYVV